ncbi:hypothetical protein NEF87_004285 [Candidatus Lokiarchaeum ossiferum]|uniref:Glycosyltransferase 2-like domain-containing protein n=1 Tax=Candidatus Lokiarchaeum ossiferum TaxID=2951803 RepID=A0ABY6HWW4_9ARCH|nr:hypothetical protein NEF87_004285 [Candidatus Lokiarchaeum sp. B-35]
MSQNGSKNIDISVIIVAFGFPDAKLKKTLANITNQSYSSYEIVLIWAKFPKTLDINQYFKSNSINSSKIQFHHFEENLGYAKGNNLGSKFAKGDKIVIMNPDVETLPAFLTEMVHTFAYLQKLNRTDKIVLNPRICNRFGNIEFAKIYLNFLGFSNNNFPMSDKIQRTMISSGCTFLISKRCFHHFHGFDESYFMYHEDTDLSYRLQKAGFKLYVDNNIPVWHLKTDYEYKMTDFKFFYWERNRLKFTLENASNLKRLLLCQLLLEPLMFVYALKAGLIKQKFMIYKYFIRNFLLLNHKNHKGVLNSYENYSSMEGIINEVPPKSIVYRSIKFYVKLLFYLYHS